MLPEGRRLTAARGLIAAPNPARIYGQGDTERQKSMPSDREKLEDAGLEQLANEMQNGPDERRYHVAYAELQRRIAEWQKEARDTQVKASDAAVETARYTRESANWMRWSVIAIAMTSGLQALFAFLTWYRADP